MTIPEARATVGRQIGLPDSFDGSVGAYSRLTPSQQTALTAQLIRYINANPGKFTTAQVQIANDRLGSVDGLLIEDASFNYEQFFTELENNAIQTMGGAVDVGRGASSALSLFGKILPFAMLAFVAFHFYKFTKKP